MHRLTDLGGGAFKWEMEKVGTEHINIQTIYASTYVRNATKGTVDWRPVEGIGNALVGGHWKVKGKKKSTFIELEITAEVHVPLPQLMHAIVEPVIESEFASLVEKYIDNLIVRFGGEVA